MEEKKIGFRLLIMVLGGFALLIGLWMGLFRLGLELPLFRLSLPSFHGPLMVSGFLGTLIGLERAVASNLRWAYAVPLLSGVGALALVAGTPDPFGITLMTLSSAGLVFLLAVIFYNHLTLYSVVITIGASFWLIGNGLWLLGFPFYKVAIWWIGFLVLTISGERLEISRMLQISNRGKAAFILAASLFILGVILVTRAFSAGVQVTGIGMVALALWLLRFDIARRTVNQEGLSRFIALSLIIGYVWLGLGGLLEVFLGGMTSGFYYDAILHSIFIGFVFSMIFAHAPVIFPAVLGLPRFLTLHLPFYAHLALLHISLILRITGDLLEWPLGRKWGGLLNAIAILLFLGNTVYLSRREAKPIKNPNIPHH
jgi:hypothetical protein